MEKRRDDKHYRKATMRENLMLIRARLSDHLSPAEMRELQEAAVRLQECDEHHAPPSSTRELSDIRTPSGWYTAATLLPALDMNHARFIKDTAPGNRDPQAHASVYSEAAAMIRMLIDAPVSATRRSDALGGISVYLATYEDAPEQSIGVTERIKRAMALWDEHARADDRAVTPCSCGAKAGQYHTTGCGYEGVFNG